MARGGAREGAGRKLGSANAKTREIANKAAENGLTPLEYMLEVMRSPIPPELAAAIESNAINVEVVSALAGWHNIRFEAAKAAAPYIHPRLQTTTIQGDKDHPLVVEVVKFAS